MKTCYIVGAGDFTSRGLAPAEGDLLIAADGGYDWLRQSRLTPDFLLGDLDSLGVLPSLPAKTKLLRYPVEKDDTDTALALEEGWNRGYRSFALYGCGGGRPDHFMANLQTMARYAKQGARICLTDPSYDVFALHNETMELPLRPRNTLVSVFCHGNEARGVTLEGLQYPLHDAALTCDIPLGVSNHYAADHPRISVREGTLLVIVYQNQQ